MNERIRELAISSGIYDCLCDPYDSHNTGDAHGSVIDDLEKFAELIVQECLGMIENEASTYAEPVWAVELVNDIKEHFGVEE
jgi:hypothetical protein